MKRRLRHLEQNLLRAAPARVLVRAIMTLRFRLRWIWGRVRFGALVRERGLGARAIILGGVTLGENAVIAAVSAIVRSVQFGQVMTGIPAKPIRTGKPRE